jgi:very-short-patch-repair endonuclease
MREEREERRARLAVLAGNQHAVVAYWQLIRLGFDRGEIDRLVAGKFLHRLHRGVYAVGHPNVSLQGSYKAAVLACGEGAVLSHWSAAGHWELLGVRQGAEIHVSAPGHRRPTAAIKAHWVPGLDGRDCTLRDRIPVTTVARTLLDLGAIATPKQLQRATNQAERKGLLAESAVRELIDRNRGRKGIKEFVAVTAAVNAGTHRTRSDLEVAFLDFCRRHHIEEPVSNGKVEGFEVDMHWPGTRLIVELDDYEYHRTPTSFEQDRRRDAELKLKGYTVIRVTGAWLDTDPHGLARTLRALLQAEAVDVPPVAQPLRQPRRVRGQ